MEIRYVNLATKIEDLVRCCAREFHDKGVNADDDYRSQCFVVKPYFFEERFKRDWAESESRTELEKVLEALPNDTDLADETHQPQGQITHVGARQRAV